MYALAPQGDFAPSDDWTLDKEATVVAGADPFSGALHSLQLEKGAEAASPAMCVNLDNPTIRFFARDVGGNGKSNLKVDVLYEDFDGHAKHLTVAKLRLGTEWAALGDRADVHELPGARVAGRRNGRGLQLQGGGTAEGRDAVDLESLRRPLSAADRRNRANPETRGRGAPAPKDTS